LFYTNIDTAEIKRRIVNFRERAKKGLNVNDCTSEISSIFGESYGFPTEPKQYEANTIFYRARVIPDNDTVLPLLTMRKVADAWEPPSKYVQTQGRLNAIGQSILYCCPNDFDLAIDEAQARNGNHVAVMVYRARKSISVSVLGDYFNSNLPKDDLSKVFFEFLDEEFSQIVASGDEGRYIITQAIADTFFNFPEQDAWCYRSVQSPTKFNVAFLPGKQSESLELSGVMICDLRLSSLGKLSVKTVVDFDQITGVARYHRIGSAQQKKLFPDLA